MKKVLLTILTVTLFGSNVFAEVYCRGISSKDDFSFKEFEMLKPISVDGDLFVLKHFFRVNKATGQVSFEKKEVLNATYSQTAEQISIVEKSTTKELFLIQKYNNVPELREEKHVSCSSYNPISCRTTLYRMGCTNDSAELDQLIYEEVEL